MNSQILECLVIAGNLDFDLSLFTRDLLIKYIEHCHPLNGVPYDMIKKYIDQDIANMAVDWYMTNFAWLPQKFITKELCLKALRKSPMYEIYLNDDENSMDYLGDVLSNIPQHLKLDPDIALEIAKHQTNRQLKDYGKCGVMHILAKYPDRYIHLPCGYGDDPDIITLMIITRNEHTLRANLGPLTLLSPKFIKRALPYISRMDSSIYKRMLICNYRNIKPQVDIKTQFPCGF